MIGMNARTGRAISGQAHIEQSVADILFTPLGTRVMRRDYGSLLPELIDGPINPLMRMRVMAASVMALARWEPRIQVTQVDFSESGIDGAAMLELHGERTDGPNAGMPVSLRVPTPNMRGRS
ncbi:GPW/gp25 family protein [Burkholderia sp. SCN-KJ]|uniref:GPW/gp25 family protein n=1 Tax=Burkholderia sp. SCN-KJ TaxID=2969248 RepID=UPI00214FB443|nr:GPW/gp25 family protein [Burkholderia sp. SCN-KJ]MCR4465848.1 GPW/gp25 family protein [Burkholderia sp. SCN-KJ]